jgi:hypothetical protein
VKRSILNLAVVSLLIPHFATAAPEAVGVPRRALTEAEVIELIANMDCIDPAQRANTVSEVEALAIATQAVTVSDTWSIEGATFKATRDECGWDVLVIRQSPGPGDHRSLRINAKGKVLAYVRGL